MKPTVQYASFVIRLWQINPEDKTTERIVKGSVEHIQSGEVKMVTGLEDVPAIIRCWFGKEPTDTGENP